MSTTAAHDHGTSPTSETLSAPDGEGHDDVSASNPGRFDLLGSQVKLAVLEADRMAQSGEVDPEVLAAAAGGDRSVLEEARNFYASLVSARSDDFRATAALRLLNRALSATPVIDPLDWKKRWHQRFRRP